MMVVDTSALMAIVLDEAPAEACMAALEAEDRVLMSAGTLAESLIVSRQRGVLAEVTTIVETLRFEILSVTAATARRVAQSYARWGKNVHPAGLNFGDCFAYAAAKELACPLLFVGNDFARTDIESVL
ncbi:MAG TPA: type II toxin-antitoxin system VapC family toxin [Acetobacteraceae bacterium]|jgi:ribonuclease VapC|nr:type II toxin-antitoxin system VapC family toxin [Acetobacteraceae bacterium]